MIIYLLSLSAFYKEGRSYYLKGFFVITIGTSDFRGGIEGDITVVMNSVTSLGLSTLTWGLMGISMRTRTQSLIHLLYTQKRPFEGCAFLERVTMRERVAEIKRYLSSIELHDKILYFE